MLILIIIIPLLLIIWLISKLLAEKKLREKLQKENSKLIADNALLDLEQLKFQLQPHTLRNMVATLHVASKNLYKGSEALSETLDYILYNGNKHLVTVADEINFLESYKSLQGNFVHQINSIKIDKSGINKNSKYYNTACIPHLITAYFIENAFKHGDVNHPEFLNVVLKLTDKTFEMSVVNRINKRSNNNKGGLGLTNMRRRLDFFHSGNFEIKNSCNENEYFSKLTINF